MFSSSLAAEDGAAKVAKNFFTRSSKKRAGSSTS